jgi:hypothetical protein
MKTSYVELSDFLIVNLHFCVKNILKRNIPSQIPCLKRKTTKKRKFCFKIPPKLSEFLLFESMLKIFHFHILNIAKFG